jgi:hypothetical protein
MKKLVLILVALIAAVTFIRAYQIPEGSLSNTILEAGVNF